MTKFHIVTTTLIVLSVWGSIHIGLITVRIDALRPLVGKFIGAGITIICGWLLTAMLR